jgi:hypothetical protein
MTEAPVVARAARRYEIVAPGDFSLGSAREIDRLPPEATPYCADFARRSLLCVTTPDIFDHPFLYQAQREQAQTVIRIPYAELPQAAVAPVLIFSPGRCGSTLLFRILKAAGLPSVSEPDCFRQVAQRFARDRSRPMKAGQRLLRAAASILAARLGSSSPVIKLHMQCNAAPLLLTRAFASVKVLFILREPRDWAVSLKRVAPAITPRGAAGSLKRALWALDRLAEAYELRICHYRDFATPHAGYVRELVSFLGSDASVSDELLQAVASRDSQEGTQVARRNLAQERIDPGYLEEFDRLWQVERPAAIIARRGLAGQV